MAGIFDDRTEKERTRHALTQAKKNKIISALGNKCEKCGKHFPQRNLKIHHIEEVAKASGTKDLNMPSNLIVLCSICHDDVHHKPIPKITQKRWIKKRSESTKSEIRNILRNRPKVNNRNSLPFTMRSPKIKSMKIDMPEVLGSSETKKKKKTREKNDLDFFKL